MEPWGVDLEQKFQLIEQADSGDQLDYENDLRQMLFNSFHAKTLSDYEGRIFALTGTKVTFKEKLSPEEEAANEKKRPYDDQQNSGNHQTEVDGDDLSVMTRIEEGKATAADKEALLKLFQRNALAETFAALELSEKELQKVLKGYTDDQMKTIGAAFIQFMNAPSTVIPGKTNLEAYQHLPLMSQSDSFTPLGKILVASDPVTNVASGKVLQDKNQEAIHSELILSLGKQFPMLCDRKINLGTLYQQFSDKKYQTINSELETRTTEYLSNIRDTRENLRDTPEMVFALDTITTNTYKSMSLTKGSASGKIVEEHIQSIKNKELAISIALAALSIGLGILSAFTGGTTAIVAASLGAGVGAYDTYREYDQYQTKHAAANTSMSQAQMLTKDDPSFLWVAVAALGTLGDIASAAKILKAVKASKTFVKPLQNADDMGRYVDEVTKAIAEEKGIKAGTEEYTAIRQTVEGGARRQLTQRAQQQADKLGSLQERTAYYDQQIEAARKAFMSGASTTNMFVDPTLVAPLTKMAYFSIMKAGGRAKFGLDDFIEMVKNAKKKKFGGIDTDDAQVRNELEAIYQKAASNAETELAQQSLRPQLHQQATDEIHNLHTAQKTAPLNEAQQRQLDMAWRQYVDTGENIPITYTYRRNRIEGEISFDDTGRPYLNSEKGAVPVDPAEMNNIILDRTNTSHALVDSLHGMDNDVNTVARRLTTNPAVVQSGKFNQDEYLFRLIEYVKKNHKQGDSFVGWDTARGKNITYTIPIPSNWGRVFANSDSVPSNVSVLSQNPFSGISELEHIVELKVKQAIVVFNRETGEFVTAYPQAVPDDLLR